MAAHLLWVVSLWLGYFREFVSCNTHIVSMGSFLILYTVIVSIWKFVFQIAFNFSGSLVICYSLFCIDMLEFGILLFKHWHIGTLHLGHYAYDVFRVAYNVCQYSSLFELSVLVLFLPNLTFSMSSCSVVGFYLLPRMPASLSSTY